MCARKLDGQGSRRCLEWRSQRWKAWQRSVLINPANRISVCYLTFQTSADVSCGFLVKNCKWPLKIYLFHLPLHILTPPWYPRNWERCLRWILHAWSHTVVIGQSVSDSDREFMAANARHYVGSWQRRRHQRRRVYEFADNPWIPNEWRCMQSPTVQRPIQ
jgi:hypothetical protein